MMTDRRTPWHLNRTDPQCSVCMERSYLPAKSKFISSRVPSFTTSREPTAIPETPFPFLSLIPEIRIKIYELLIEDATTCSTNIDIPRTKSDQDVYQYASGEPRNVVHRRKFVLNEHHRDDKKIYCRLSRRCTSISNITPIPLLFVNKQIHNEVVALVYPKFSSLMIVPSIMTWEDDIHWWNETYPLRWAAMREATSLEIRLDSDLVKRFSNNWRDVQKGCTRRDWFTPWPNIPALLQVIEDLRNLKSVKIEVNVPGDPSLSFNSMALQGDDCFSWLFPFREVEKRDVLVKIEFVKKGRCSGMYQKRWDQLCKKRDKAARRMPSLSPLAI